MGTIGYDKPLSKEEKEKKEEEARKTIADMMANYKEEIKFDETSGEISVNKRETPVTEDEKEKLEKLKNGIYENTSDEIPE